jgi:RNA polymerase sigma-70 factor (ECF subfamily)
MTGGEDELECLFRREWAHLVATLTRSLGPSQLSLVEDAVHEALVTAMQTWQLSAPPSDPRAWLLTTAKNRAIDRLRRERRFVSLPEAEWDEVEATGSESEAAESQLAMMLAICDDELAQETHVTLILRVLCGLSPAEIARAFLVDVGVIDRRLHRGKARLRSLGSLPDARDAQSVHARLPSVMQALYLLFSEGYQGSDAENALQPGLCEEALRLGELLARSPAVSAGDRLELQALRALFCFQAARLSTRVDETGVLVALAEQDRTRWDRRLIESGLKYLSSSASGQTLTRWHIEAGIACEHALAPSTDATNWKRIVDLYEDLLRVLPTPVVELNRALAIAELRGLAEGREALERIQGDRKLVRYPFFWSALADIERRAGELESARAHYARAIQLARNPAERIAYERRLRLLEH